MHPLRRAAPVTSRHTHYVALHPLRRATPVTSQCTRSEEVQCLQIGCTASHNKHNRGQFAPTDPNRPPRTQQHSFNMLARLRTRGATPVTSRYTRYVAMHPLRRDTPDQKRCNAYRSGAAPPTTSTTAKTFRLARSRAGCPSATGAALLSQFSSPGPGRPAATWRGERPRRRHPDPCRTGHLR